MHQKLFLKSCSSQILNRNFICLYNLTNAACSTAKACCWVSQDLQNHNPPIINLNCRANMAIWCERGISFYIRKSSSALPADKNSLHLSTIVPAWGSQWCEPTPRFVEGDKFIIEPSLHLDYRYIFSQWSNVDHKGFWQVKCGSQVFLQVKCGSQGFLASKMWITSFLASKRWITRVFGK